MPASKTPRRRFSPFGTTTLALVGIAVGLAIYTVAFVMNSPHQTCVPKLLTLSLEHGATEITKGSYSTEWAGFVTTRCEAILVNGPNAGATLSERVMEWGPSAVAASGLAVAVTGLWFLLPPPRKKVGSHAGSSWPFRR
ncbi:hypothetical protein G6030_02385 [Dietzia sp. E1]|uniref:hypothetical protein n=1 Tax=Dietzia TaxID=37914 RepID=UPI0010436475|nr:MULTISPECIES: hypothetical protein [Dietzia]MBB1020150.1 hypothetical protein [Dietzia sp. E1]